MELHSFKPVTPQETLEDLRMRIDYLCGVVGVPHDAPRNIDVLSGRLSMLKRRAKDAELMLALCERARGHSLPYTVASGEESYTIHRDGRVDMTEGARIACMLALFVQQEEATNE